MSEINENTMAYNFDIDFEYIEDHYEYILRPFENMLQTGEKIDTFTEEKLKHIKEANLEYMICAVCVKNGFFNIMKWLSEQEKPCNLDEKICEIATFNGNLNILQWLRAQDPPCPWNAMDCLLQTQVTGNLEMEEWLNSQIIVVNLIKEEKSTINIPDEDCFICGIENVNVETVCCSHYYCYKCLNMWFHRENPSCPNCRRVLEKCFVKTL